MNLLDIKLLEKSIEAVESVDIITEATDNTSTETKNSENITSNVTIEDKTQISNEKNNTILSPTKIEELEDKINTDSMVLGDVITESFYNLNRNLSHMIALSETISIDTINKQYKILTECSYGTDEYNDKISTLIESSGDNLIQKLINAIKNFIAWCKDTLSKLGVQISVHFVDYEKWASSKENELVEKASNVGNRVSAKFHKWNKEKLFEDISIKEIESIAESYIGITNNKDTMKDYIDEFTNKYETVTEAASDVYVHALATIAGGDPDNRVMSDKNMAKEAFIIKLKGKEKDIYMDAKTTATFVTELKKIKTSTSKFISSMRNNSVNSKFNQLIKDAEKGMHDKEDKPDSTKYQYFNIRFHILTAVQNAINDAYKIKCQLMKEYANEMYKACKQLDSFKEETSNESIDFSSANNYIGGTLHA